MIGIINQHKGEFSELINNIIDFEDHLKSKQFIQVWIIDQSVSTEEKKEIDSHRSDNCFFLFNDYNIGLSPSRGKAIDCLMSFSEYKELDISQIILNSTNSKWLVPLTDELHDQLVVNTGVIIYPVRYKNELGSRDRSTFNYSQVSVSDFINNLIKPDCGYIINAKKLRNNYHFIADEKYYPEDRFLYECAENKYIQIINQEFQECWYNDNGMSRTFSRSTVHSSRRGFREISEFFIDEFIAGRINLSYEVLKRYVTNLVVCSEDIPFKKYENTLIYPMLIDRVTSWSLNKTKHHKVKFIEDYDS